MDIWKDIREELKKHTVTYEYLNNLGETIKQFPDFNPDCLSKGQLYSKLWLVNKLKNITTNLGNVCLYGGWYALIVEMLFNNFNIRKVTSYDIDFYCKLIADEINIHYVMEGQFEAITENINYVDCNSYDTIINLSCEHLKDNKWFEKVPEGKLVILQSNNFCSISEHVSCIHNLKEMTETYKLNNIMYSGVLHLKQYERFMIIGVK